ncbi:MAG: SsrA-binding protein SmpB [Candidatus Eremiobacteraeota bacterium]|nr:SsrA-binding protein SmpB [Candidatus Eremiobacteraeota bacterium]
MSEGKTRKRIATNKRARHEYHILEKLEAGLVLVGTEVKSLRQGKVTMTDAFAALKDGEVWLFNLHISPFEKGNRFNHDPRRPRKLLLHGREIEKLIEKTEEKGLTIVPLDLYFLGGRVKCEIGVVRGKKLHDKRATSAERTAKREIDRALKDANR